MAGSVLAIAQPGDLGGEDTAGPAQETTTSTTQRDLTTTTTLVVTTTTTTTAPATTSTTSGTGATTTTLPGEGTTTTTVAGSGLGQGGTPSGGADGVADTGGKSMIGAGMALGALGLLLRRATRPA